ncbi:dynein axonemal heavy chain 10 [Lutzomyia longipalpis]|nr:dynein axonemal heavy chain 10 [Lutzomyia longipalpis]
MDPRFLWLRQKLSHFFGVYDYERIDILLNDNFEGITEFFEAEIDGASSTEKRVIFIYRTFYNRLVETEITVLEEVPHVQTPEPEPVREKKRKGKGKEKKGKDLKEEDAEVKLDHDYLLDRPDAAKLSEKDVDVGTYLEFAAELEEEVTAEPEVDYVEVKKIIQNYVKTPILNCHFGRIPQESFDRAINYVFLIRKNPFPVVRNLLVNIFHGTANYHFREPKLEHRSTIEDSQEGDTEKILPDGGEEDEQEEKLDLTRPSEYWNVAITAKRAGFCASGDDSHLESTRKLSLTPQVMPQALLVVEAKKPEGEENAEPLVRKMLLNSIEIMDKQLEWTISCVTSHFTLPTAYNQAGQEYITFDEDKIKIAIDPENCNLDNYTQLQLEDVVNGWMRYTNKFIKMYSEKEPDTFSPIAEYDLWREREKEFNNLLEQLNHTFVASVLAKLNEFKSDIENLWSPCLESLKTSYFLARENSEYLSTLQKYLLTIKTSENFQLIHTLLPNLMLALRHIWTMSSYYGQDDNMRVLLQKISFVFTEKIKDIMSLKKLFANSAVYINDQATQSANLLQSWKKAYIDTRTFIEVSNISSRWEFDRNLLFQDVDHIAHISQDIAEISQIFIEFENMFNARLKSIITDPEEVDNIMKRVYSLVDLIVQIDYDVFRSGNLENWMATLDLFKRKIQMCETQGKFVLDNCIESLRSAEYGLELIADLPVINTRQIFTEHMQRKYESVLKKFLTEITLVENEFMKNITSPPLLREQPHCAGTIIWERLLYQHLRKSVVAFQLIEGDPKVAKTYLSQIAMTQYFDLTQKMLNYEKEFFKEFEHRAIYTVNRVLQGNILRLEFIDSSQFSLSTINKLDERHTFALKKRRVINTKSKAVRKFISTANTLKWLFCRPKASNLDLAKANEYIRGMSKDAKYHRQVKEAKFLIAATNQVKIPTWTEVIGSEILIKFNVKFAVNFSHDIFNVIAEGHQFEYLDYKMKPVIRMAIMRKDTLYLDLIAVRGIIRKYNEIIEKLSIAEIFFLKDLLHEIESIIQAGLGRYTWQAFNITTFCERCKMLLKHLSAVVLQIQYIANDVKQRVSRIENFSLMILGNEIFGRGEAGQELRKSSLRKQSKEFTTSKSSKRDSRVTIVEPNSILPCHEYFRELNNRRNEKMNVLQRQYESIGPQLIKLESLVLGTYTGESEKMGEYYEHWQREIFHALAKFTQNNLNQFVGVLRDEPIFQVDATLSITEIILRPTAKEIYNIVLHSANDFLNRTKTFTRWMQGTCIPCTYRVKVEHIAMGVDSTDAHHDAPPSVSFFEDIILNPSIGHAIKQIETIIAQSIADIRKYLTRWKKYKSLWMFDKAAICEKFLNKGMPLIRLDEKFLFYMQIVSDLAKHKPHYDVKAIRINLRPLIESVKTHAIEWKNTLGNILAERTRNNMFQLRNQIKILKRDLDRNINGLVDFKTVMQTISTIQSTTLTVEIQVKEMQEIFSILEEHCIRFSFTDMLMSYELEKRWKKLYKSSLYRSATLEVVKTKFASLTSVEISSFTLNLDEFIKKFNDMGPGSVGDDMNRGLDLMDTFDSLFDTYEAQRLDLVNAEKLFDMPLTDYTGFLRTKKDFENLKMIYKLYRQQRNAKENWSKTMWVHMNPNTLTNGMENYMHEFRLWPLHIQEIPVAQTLKRKMEHFKESIPLMLALKNDALRRRHWERLMTETNCMFDHESGEKVLLESIFAMKLYKHRDTVNEILTTAVKELSIENAMIVIETTWDEMTFAVLEHLKEGERRGFILGNIDNITQALEDNFVKLQSMSFSPVIGPFLDDVKEWEKKLSLVSEIIDAWINVQAKWLYLEGIFIGTNIRDELTIEAQQFDSIDREYREIMQHCAKELNVIPVCMMPNRLETFKRLSSGMERCQKALDDFLVKKRQIFPRFYFISSDELLSILGRTRENPLTIQSYIIKMFDNVRSLKTSQMDDISSHLPPTAQGVELQMPRPTKLMSVVGMIAENGELLNFRNAVPLNGGAEEWMNAILSEMQLSNRYVSKKAIYDFGIHKECPRLSWIQSYPTMVVVVANQIWWTAQVEEVFAKIEEGNRDAMKEYLETQNAQLECIVAVIRGELTPRERQKLKILTIIDIHARDTIDGFVQDSVCDSQEFRWDRQLRFYWLKEFDNIVVVQCGGRFMYGYEYVGLTSRLVMTPQTDRIYLAITQALTLNLSVALEGGAGTGKTEIIKDLAKTMALLCVVTNCGHGLDYPAFTAILCGLVQCGVWGCFDEFNRIDITLLNVISTRLQAIRSALVMKTFHMIFDDREIQLDRKVGIFVTIHPAYLGRTELSQSIKSFFRPITCLAPDYEAICMILLFSEGFTAAKLLARKMTTLYKLAKSQLSRQNHYDWGIRSLMTILTQVGEMKRNQPDGCVESAIVVRVLRDVNFIKLIPDDVRIFLNLIKDLFPGESMEGHGGDAQINNAIAESYRTLRYATVGEQEIKVRQLWETITSHHTVMLLGGTGGGKSTVQRILLEALNSHLNWIVKSITLNPKAYSIGELYGYFALDTHRWHDGLISKIFREINTTVVRENERRFICFDGDVDPHWIENMNSVLDNNKLLILTNGERIQLQNHCTLLFEIGHLKYASPATISRCAVIYIDPINLGFVPYWRKWLDEYENNGEKQQLIKLFDRYIVPTLKILTHSMPNDDTQEETTHISMVIERSALSLVIQFCDIFSTFCPTTSSYTADVLECHFICCLYLSLGATVAEGHREKFDQFVKMKINRTTILDTKENPANATQLPISRKTLYEYLFDPEKNLWIAWEWIVPDSPSQLVCTKRYQDILVQTADTIQINYLLRRINKINRPIVVIGDVGSAKTTLINNFLMQQNGKQNVKLNLNFSYRTKSLDVQSAIEGMIEKRTKFIYGPAMGKHVSVFIDDMNMPHVDEYGTQEPIALLKQLLEYEGLFDRSNDLRWKLIRDLSFFAAMGRPGGGRNDIDGRFLSKFFVLYVPPPTENTLRHIYTSILRGHFADFAPSIQLITDVIIQMTVNLLRIIRHDLPPTPSRFHYIFNMKDLSRICGGIMQTHPDLFKDSRQILRLWRNEFSRVICDRFISREDWNLFAKHLTNEVEHHFPPCESAPGTRREVDGMHLRQMGDTSSTVHSSDEGCGSRLPLGEEMSKEIPVHEYILRDPLLFGDYRNTVNDAKHRYYEDLLDYEAIYFLFQEILDEYQQRNRLRKLDLVLFEDCLEHLTRLHRLLRMNRGHATLVGLDGFGRQSMCKLAAFAAECDLFKIVIDRNYSENTFRSDLKRLYQQLATKSRKTVFMLTENELLHDSFLEHIHNILTTGTVPTLFTDDEKNALIGNHQQVDQQFDYQQIRRDLWSKFLDGCMDNLHIVLCISPVGDSFRRRCRYFPSLIGETTINWIFPWPEQALFTVARVFLAEHPQIPEIHRENIICHVVHVQKTIVHYAKEFLKKFQRRFYVTPKHYLNFLHMFLNLIEKYQSSMSTQHNKLLEGINRVTEAVEQIDQLKIMVEEQQRNVVDSEEKCASMLNNIENLREKINLKQTEISLKSIDVKERTKQIELEKTTAEEVLMAAIPLLEKARLALGDLEKSDITEIRSFATPPEAIQVLCECLLILKGAKDVSWKAARTVMAEADFLKNLQEMNCDTITQKQLTAVKNHMKKTTKMEDMKAISKTGYGLLMFLKAVIQYCEMVREVKPVQERVKKLEQELCDEVALVNGMNEEVKSTQDELSNYSVEYQKLIEEKQVLQEMLEQAERRLFTSDRMMIGLKSQLEKWSSDLNKLEVDKPKVVGNCLLSASFLSYAGPFSSNFRQSIVYDDWYLDILAKEIPIDTPFKIQNVLLTDDSDIILWSKDGLPNDDFSQENAILTLYSMHFPLCIDPQQQALEWIKSMEEKNDVKVTNFSDTNFLRELESAIECGRPIVFEDIDDYVDLIIENVLVKNVIVHEDGHQFVMVGDHRVSFNANFRLYLVTKMSNPHLSSVIFSQASVINFTLTHSGLEDKLLTIAVGMERPDVEVERNQLGMEIVAKRQMLREQEVFILHELATTIGNILDNIALISTLEMSNAKYEDICQHLSDASQKILDNDSVRNLYRDIACYGACVYLAIADMAQVNVIYQYSWASFITHFQETLTSVTERDTLEMRATTIKYTLLKNIYNWCTVGIFQRDQLLFTFGIVLKLGVQCGDLHQREIDFLLGGSSMNTIEVDAGSADARGDEPLPQLKFMTKRGMDDARKLVKEFPDKFSELVASIEMQCDLWEVWCHSEAPEDLSVPLMPHVNNFEKLMVLRCFRRDRLYRAIHKYVINALGEEFVEPTIINYREILDETSSSVPVIFVSTPGTNPTEDIVKLSSSPDMVRMISLGVGQEARAWKLLEECMTTGQWLLYENAHNLPKFMRQVEQYFHRLRDVDENFRLWITMSESDVFPTGLLEKSVKIVTEIPVGLKHNLKSTISRIDFAALEAFDHPALKPLVFVLTFFHGVVQERRRYGKIGWNIPYEFNDTDFNISQQILCLYLTKALTSRQSRISWDILKCLIGDIVYGGRVFDEYDNRVVSSYMDEYFGNFLFDTFQPFHFAEDFNVHYTFPISATKQQFIDTIDSLPLDTSAEFLGLHTNAEMTYYKNAIEIMLRKMRKFQPKEGDEDSKEVETSRTEIIQDIVSDILGQIPRQYDIEKVRKAYQINITPTGVVLIQELELFNTLIHHMKRHLMLIKEAISGDAQMDEVLEVVVDALFSGRLPDEWRRFAPETCKSLGGWMEHLQKRNQQYKYWSLSGEPLVMWLSGLHVPRSYITALIQIAARENNWLLERSTTFTTVTDVLVDDDIEERPFCGCYTSGLFLQGARWDATQNCLAKSHPKVLSEQLPVVLITPTEEHRLRLQNIFQAPVYTTSNRRDKREQGFEFQVDLRTSAHESFWVLHGVCLLLNTD